MSQCKPDEHRFTGPQQVRLQIRQVQMQCGQLAAIVSSSRHFYERRFHILSLPKPLELLISNAALARQLLFHLFDGALGQRGRSVCTSRSAPDRQCGAYTSCRTK